MSTTGELVRDGRHIAAQYARTWLTLDLLSSVPWAEVLMVGTGSWGTEGGKKERAFV